MANLEGILQRLRDQRNQAQQEVKALESAISALQGTSSPGRSKSQPRGRRTMSAAARKGLLMHSAEDGQKFAPKHPAIASSPKELFHQQPGRESLPPRRPDGRSSGQNRRRSENGAMYASNSCWLRGICPIHGGHQHRNASCNLGIDSAVAKATEDGVRHL